MSGHIRETRLIRLTEAQSDSGWCYLEEKVCKPLSLRQVTQCEADLR